MAMAAYTFVHQGVGHSTHELLVSKNSVKVKRGLLPLSTLGAEASVEVTWAAQLWPRHGGKKSDDTPRLQTWAAFSSALPLQGYLFYR